jgi:hypothetical protein
LQAGSTSMPGSARQPGCRTRCLLKPTYETDSQS